MTRPTADFVVLGAGVAGCVAAICLRRAGYDVMLVGESAPRGSPGEALTSSVRALLSDLGLHGLLDEQTARPWVATETTWGGPIAAERTLLAQGSGDGWHLDRDAFNSALLTAASRILGQDRVFLARDVRAVWSAGWQVSWRELSGRKSELRALQALDVTGRRRVVARAAGARIQILDRLTGWHGTVPCGPAAAMVTVVMSAPEGWWYATPLPGQRAAVCWLTDSDLQAPGTVADRAFQSPATELFERLGANPSDWTPSAVPAATGFLDCPVGPDWAAAGDAALSHDPLSGQGLEFALRSAVRASGALAARHGGDAGPGQVYADMVARRAAAMTASRCHIYGAEQRWPNETFWRRRHQIAAAPDPSPTRHPTGEIVHAEPA